MKVRKVESSYNPDSFIKLLGYMRAYFHLPYKQTEGVVRALTTNTVSSIPDYSRICRRINRLNITISDIDKSDYMMTIL
jgi:hypothetical protein